MSFEIKSGQKSECYKKADIQSHINFPAKIYLQKIFYLGEYQTITKWANTTKLSVI